MGNDARKRVAEITGNSNETRTTNMVNDSDCRRHDREDLVSAWAWTSGSCRPGLARPPPAGVWLESLGERAERRSNNHSTSSRMANVFDGKRRDRGDSDRGWA